MIDADVNGVREIELNDYNSIYQTGTFKIIHLYTCRDDKKVYLIRVCKSTLFESTNVFFACSIC